MLEVNGDLEVGLQPSQMSFHIKAKSLLGACRQRSITEGRVNNKELRKLAGNSGEAGLSGASSQLPPAEHLLMLASLARTRV